MFRRVAIIGGGAAAATLLSELLEHTSPQPLQLDWFTGGGTPARGVAYGTASERHLLNVRAASMSMFAGKPRGFLDFVQRDDPTIAGTDFLPRRRYGDYLEAEVARALQQGKARGHHVNILPFAVDALVPESGGVTVIHGEESHPADAAVLALGALPPQPLAGVGAAALASGRYVVDPWRLLADTGALQPPPRKVVLIGLGLTAVDVLLELSAQWPQAEFVAISRHGRFPEAHLHAAAAPADDGVALVEAMHDAPEIRRWMRLLREAIAQEGSEWRAVVDGLRPHLPGLWAELSPEQRARFMRHARWAWERVRHRMPPQVCETIAALESDGRLQRRYGRVQAVDAAGNALQLSVSHAGATRLLDADLVIQTVGLETDLRRCNHRLVSQLLTNAHVIADPLGLGVQADSDGRLRHGEQYWPNLFAIGSLLRGTLWESTAMPEIRQQARHLANQLLGD
ncbi:FAD/NAD(P)-binding protein [Rhodanobacter sp. B2A1Ga4]|uniref:FAD/NAD(P)-binding protein n=1 Tax=Rhodanobacter TaxID=75309 RepID=UPI000D37F3EB|nr:MULTISPECIES: FAD/NAD(P)-binding protein [Rhodanobacter]MBQ4854786.1 FAD/NAD(P)-binding protein [Rhodanobacter sp. B2A1Ga4]